MGTYWGCGRGFEERGRRGAGTSVGCGRRTCPEARLVFRPCAPPLLSPHTTSISGLLVLTSLRSTTDLTRPIEPTSVCLCSRLPAILVRADLSRLAGVYSRLLVRLTTSALGPCVLSARSSLRIGGAADPACEREGYCMQPRDRTPPHALSLLRVFCAHTSRHRACAYPLRFSRVAILRSSIRPSCLPRELVVHALVSGLRRRCS